jgi:hypothetical protein
MTTTNFPKRNLICACGMRIDGAIILIHGRGKPVCLACALLHCMRKGKQKCE